MLFMPADDGPARVSRSSRPGPGSRSPKLRSPQRATGVYNLRLMSALPQIILKPNKRGTFLARHPWVLEKSIVAPASCPEDGEVVDLVSPEGRWIARGIFNGRSYIRVRLYSWTPGEQLDEAFWRRPVANRRRAAAAARLRRSRRAPRGWSSARPTG